ncbi:MAG TPA: hypothetical protein VFN05_01775, partial [Actinomycetes bacterium]|nr:hypothetical protein [Actinomycetes bacterium]
MIEDDAFRHRCPLLGGDADPLHRAHGRGDVQHYCVMAPGGQAVGEGVGAEHGSPSAGRGDQRDEVGAREADQAGLGRQPGVGRRDQELPVPDRGHRHALTLAGAIDAPAHRLGRRAGSTAAVAIEEDRPVGLVQHPHARSRVQRAVEIEASQYAEGCDPVVGMAAKLRVHQEPAQSLGVLGCELQALEGSGETASQVIDPHQPHVPVLVGHSDLPSPALLCEVLSIHLAGHPRAMLRGPVLTR